MNKILGRLFIVVIFVAFSSLTLKAQDVIITKKGDVLNAYRTELSSTSIFYTLENNENSPIQKVDKKDVLMIKKKDGTQLNFYSEKNSENSDTPKDVMRTAKSVVPCSREDIDAINAYNRKIIEYYNNPNVAYIDDKSKKKGKNATKLYCQFFVTENSQFCDENIELEYVTGSIVYEFVDKRMMSRNMELKPVAYNNTPFPNQSPYIQVSIKNKSDMTIYIDLGNTFIKRQSESFPYYIPKSTSTTNGTSSGGSINLGSVGNVLGIGGAVGQLANGVNMGGGGSTSSTNTVFSQRIISIPPHSTKKLDEQEIFPLDFTSYPKYIKAVRSTTRVPIVFFIPKDRNMKCGTEWLYTEQNTPLSWGTYITYSFNETCSDNRHLQADFYMGKIIGDGYSKTLSSNWDKVLSIQMYRW